MLHSPAVKSSHTPFPASQPCSPVLSQHFLLWLQEKRAAVLISAAHSPPSAAQLALTKPGFSSANSVQAAVFNSPVSEDAAVASVAEEKELARCW